MGLMYGSVSSARTPWSGQLYFYRVEGSTLYRTNSVDKDWIHESPLICMFGADIQIK